jgi:hypothetical protein
MSTAVRVSAQSPVETSGISRRVRCFGHMAFALNPLCHNPPMKMKFFPIFKDEGEDHILPQPGVELTPPLCRGAAWGKHPRAAVSSVVQSGGGKIVVLRNTGSEFRCALPQTSGH